MLILNRFHPLHTSFLTIIWRVDLQWRAETTTTARAPKKSCWANKCSNQCHQYNTACHVCFFAIREVGMPDACLMVCHTTQTSEETRRPRGPEHGDVGLPPCAGCTSPVHCFVQFPWSGAVQRTKLRPTAGRKASGQGRARESNGKATTVWPFSAGTIGNCSNLGHIVQPFSHIHFSRGDKTCKRIHKNISAKLAGLSARHECNPNIYSKQGKDTSTYTACTDIFPFFFFCRVQDFSKGNMTNAINCSSIGQHVTQIYLLT